MFTFVLCFQKCIFKGAGSRTEKTVATFMFFLPELKVNHISEFAPIWFKPFNTWPTSH